MASIALRVDAILSEKQGILLDNDSLLSIAISAVRFYGGYAMLSVFSSNPDDFNVDDIDLNTDITGGEWAIIKPLFLLYLEREQATALEASRGLGIDVYGRSSSEIAMDIKEYEAIIPSKSFSEPIFSIGVN